MPNYSTRLQHLQPGQQGERGAGSISSNFWPAIRQRGVPMLMAGNLGGGPVCPMGLVSGRLLGSQKMFESRIYPRWWSGGVAGAISQVATAPMDLLESRMVAIKKEISLIDSLRRAIRQHGFLSLYDGLGAQILRQLTYTTLRFHLYELGKKQVDDCSFMVKLTIASMSGCVAGVVGIPMEVVNTRMQIDRALPSDNRWNYRNVFDGLYRVAKEDGFKALYSSFFLTCVRGAVSTVGQNAVYDQAKESYIQLFDLKRDSSFLHLISSVTAVCVFGPIIQPVENIRTLKMVRNIGLLDCISYLISLGPLGPFRGIVPSMLRLMPNTIMTLLLYEKIRATFGYQGTTTKGCP